MLRNKGGGILTKRRQNPKDLGQDVAKQGGILAKGLGGFSLEIQVIYFALITFIPKFLLIQKTGVSNIVCRIFYINSRFGKGTPSLSREKMDEYHLSCLIRTTRLSVHI